MPIPFKFSKVAHFKTSVQSGRLIPQSKYSIDVIFQPKNLGHFKNTIQL